MFDASFVWQSSKIVPLWALFRTVYIDPQQCDSICTISEEKYKQGLYRNDGKDGEQGSWPQTRSAMFGPSLWT